MDIKSHEGEIATVDDLKDVLSRMTYRDLKQAVKEVAPHVNYSTPKIHGLSDALADWANDEEIKEDAKEVRATS
jgi:hypothetical protein